MIPYLIVFLIVILLTYKAEKEIEIGHKNKAYAYIFFSILIMSVLAGIRNSNIGKDVQNYVIPSFKWALEFNFFEFIKIGNLEIGYMSFTYIITRIFKDYHFILFFIQVFISIGIYMFAYKERKNIPMYLVMLTYLLTMYNDTLTMMRQYIAIFLIILSYLSIREKKYVKTFILYGLALTFHFTAIVAILGYVLIIINYSDKIKVSLKKHINIIIFVVFGFFILFNKDILYFLTNTIEIIPIKFYEYFNTEYYLKTLNISKSVLLFKVICILLALLYKKIVRKDEISKLIVMFLVIDLGIYVISFKLGPVMRLGYYFSYPALLYLIPKIPNMLKKDRFNKIVIHIIIVVFLFSFWYFNNVFHSEAGNTSPYRSDIVRNLFN